MSHTTGTFRDWLLASFVDFSMSWWHAYRSSFALLGKFWSNLKVPLFTAWSVVTLLLVSLSLCTHPDNVTYPKRVMLLGRMHSFHIPGLQFDSGCGWREIIYKGHFVVHKIQTHFVFYVLWIETHIFFLSNTALNLHYLEEVFGILFLSMAQKIMWIFSSFPDHRLDGKVHSSGRFRCPPQGCQLSLHLSRFL